jgi:hypothetical protein
MEEALTLTYYLPMSYKTESEGAYIQFLWDAFQSNYESGKYEFSSLAFHLLYMSFVSFSIWQIKMVRELDFKKALVGFNLEQENKLLEAENPFKFYEKLKESQIFRFLKLIGCANNQVGEFAKFVKRRNRIAHPCGTVFFNDEVSIETEIIEMMKEVDNIQGHMRPVIMEIYERFLIDSSNADDREYSDPDDEIEASLIHRNYISIKDIDCCFQYDLAQLRSNPNYPEIEKLHQRLFQKYNNEDN